MYNSQDQVNRYQNYESSGNMSYDTRSLPRSKRSKEEYSYGSLPRSNKAYGDGYGGRGRGRGISKAPSQRRIDRQREVRREAVDRLTRASSVPKQNSYESAMPISRSMMSIWTPDGKCPSFADMLKSSLHLEEAHEGGQEERIDEEKNNSILVQEVVEESIKKEDVSEETSPPVDLIRHT